MDLLKLFLEYPSICTDNRKATQGAIFFALKGANFNGNRFAQQALDAGCAYAVIDEAEFNKGDQYILVDDVLSSLQNLATSYRNTFSFPFLAITGSNGKTTTKELVREVLKKKFRVHATKGNFNNHIGVPLTILSMPQNSEFAIIEMGANHQKEIAALCEIAEPTIGLITNIGKAHLEGFGGIEGVKIGKGELFDYLRKQGNPVFVNSEMEHLTDMSKGMTTIPYGGQNDNFHLNIVENNPTIRLALSANNQEIEFQTNLTGAYNIHNFATAIAVGLHFGVTVDEICSAIATYIPDNQRSQVEKTASNCLILDAYNANPSSMKVALQNLLHIDSENGLAIIGDMFELGNESHELHQEIADFVEANNIPSILIGEAFSGTNSRMQTFKSTEEARTWISKNPLKGKTILIKGSRGMRLEQLQDLL